MTVDEMTHAIERVYREQARAMPHWLEHYNTRRPHSSIGGRPPISRVHNLCGQDSWTLPSGSLSPSHRHQVTAAAQTTFVTNVSEPAVPL
jgi:hypothetical protein